MESLTSRLLPLKAGVQKEDEPMFKLLVEDWRNLASILTSICSVTAGKILLCFMPWFTIYRTAIPYHPYSCKDNCRKDNVEMRAREVPRSWWEPKALCVVINWNDNDVRNPLFNTKTHHMVYFNINPYHVTLLLTPSVTSSLSGRMTDLFSAFSLICPCFTLPHLIPLNLLDYPQPLAHPMHASHHFCLQPADSGSPFALSAFS